MLVGFHSSTDAAVSNTSPLNTIKKSRFLSDFKHFSVFISKPASMGSVYRTPHTTTGKYSPNISFMPAMSQAQSWLGLVDRNLSGTQLCPQEIYASFSGDRDIDQGLQ
jgi:hypothetical protein